MRVIYLCILGCIAVASTTIARAQELLTGQPPIWSTKPDIPAFEKMENDRLAAAQRAIDKIVANKGAKTVDNTVANFDEATRQLNAANAFSSLMEAVHPDVGYRDHATAMTRKISVAQTALALNRGVYDALAAVPLGNADAVTQYYVKRQLLEFRLAGVDKDEATRARLKVLNDQKTAEQSAFDRNINDGQKTVDVHDASQLAGLPKDYIDSHKPDKNGIVHITTDYPDYLPVMTFANSEALRRRMYIAFNTRAYPKNRDVLMSLLRTRYEMATLLGFPSWADYHAADKMIGTAARIGEFIKELDAAQRPGADREFQMLLAQKKKTDPQATTIGVAQRAYYEEQVRRSDYNFDSQSVRPYFPYERVKQGILDTAGALFRVSFRREEGVPAWDPAVETWLVVDTGKVIGRIYLDMHPRPGKYSHAEMMSLLDGVRGKHLPEGILICNFPQPSASDPGLMEYDDVQTFFHEFGHLMHGILGGQQPWAGISGISMESDFVEAPSQMLEEWIRSPQVLASFAKDYQSGKPIPAELVARMNRAAAFGRAGWVGSQLAYTAVSYDIYEVKPSEVNLDTVLERNLRKYTPYVPIAQAHMFASFTHLSGYSSAYYTYLWDKVIALDFFEQFDPKNVLAGDAPLRYRRTVLEPGGSVSANDLVKNFLGRPQSVDALRRWMGAEFNDSPR
jgi:thimet oligopeptidase